MAKKYRLKIKDAKPILIIDPKFDVVDGWFDGLNYNLEGQFKLSNAITGDYVWVNFKSEVDYDDCLEVKLDTNVDEYDKFHGTDYYLDIKIKYVPMEVIEFQDIDDNIVDIETASKILGCSVEDIENKLYRTYNDELHRSVKKHVKGILNKDEEFKEEVYEREMYERESR